VRNRRRRTYDERAALTLQEISRKKPGLENRVAQEIEDHCAGVRLDRRRNIRIDYRFCAVDAQV